MNGLVRCPCRQYRSRPCRKKSALTSRTPAGAVRAARPRCRRYSARSPPAHPARCGKKLLAFLGPGYLVAVGYMDPGNWATSLAGGSKFGYALLTIALLSNLMAILLQALCARLGIGAGRDLAQACRDAFPRAVSMAALGAGRNCDLRDRPRRGDRHRDRAQSPVRHSARDRRADHRARRVPDPVAAESRLPLDRGLHRDAARRDRGLLCDPDRDGRSGLARGDRAALRRRPRSSPIRRCSISRSASSAPP